MAFYQLKRIQQIPVSLDEAWDFFSSPQNLQRITPPQMQFTTTSFPEPQMYPGQIITYKVSPLFGIPVDWMTEICYVKEKEYFVDEQRFGPYALWHHKHFFRQIPGGVEMTDIVDYKIPLGMLGKLAHVLFVKKKLLEVFDYRYKKVEELFGKMGG